MTLKGRITDAVHGVLCQPNRTMAVENGCCGCNASEADVYLTIGCGYCQSPGESYCWSCADEPGWLNGVTLADFTVLPGRERS